MISSQGPTRCSGASIGSLDSNPPRGRRKCPQSPTGRKHAPGLSALRRTEDFQMKYMFAWLLGVPGVVIILWFLVSHH